MVTVFSRCQHHGYTDNITTSKVGEIIARQFYIAGLNQNRIRVESKEPHGNFMVWSYPEDWIETIDRAIKDVNNAINADALTRLPLKQDRPKRKRINGH